MKEEINLLPPQKIKVRWLGIYFGKFGDLLRVASLALIVVLGAELAVYGVNMIISRSLDDELSGQTKSYALLEERLIRTNELLAEERRWLNRTQVWTPVVEDVLESVPVGVILTEMEASRGREELTVAGVVTSRQALLNFQRALESVDEAVAIEAPLSNFATGGESSFTFTLKLSDENLEE